jgi:hypothetical protein
MIAGWVIALMGIALLIYGGVIIVSMTVAKRTLALAAETEAFKRAQASVVVKAGDGGVEWLVAKIPFGFVRDMIRRQLGEEGTTDFAIATLQGVLSDMRFGGVRVGLLGLAVCVVSYWAGPWLTRTVNGLFGFDGAPA